MGFRIVMLGAPGAGKGTQALRIAERFGLPHISTGDIFRAHLKEGTDLGRQVREYLDGGRLVPDELTCAIVADRTGQADCAKGYVLDGFPRSVPQAEALDQTLEARGEQLDAAIDVDVPDAVIVERLAARRSCPKCGAVYNIKFTPSALGDKCDRPGCGADLVQRSDDCEETILERLRVYHETTKPIIGYYERQGILRSVPGAEGTPDAIFAKVEAILNELGTA